MQSCGFRCDPLDDRIEILNTYITRRKNGPMHPFGNISGCCALNFQVFLPSGNFLLIPARESSNYS